MTHLRDNDVAHKTMTTSAKLIFFCGKMAAGKFTLARELASDSSNRLVPAGKQGYHEPVKSGMDGRQYFTFVHHSGTII